MESAGRVASILHCCSGARAGESAAAAASRRVGDAGPLVAPPMPPHQSAALHLKALTTASSSLLK